MSNQIDQIAQFLFETENLDNISVDQLRQLVDEFPSFNAGHYLLTQKLQDQNSPELNKEVQKTVLYFHNPFWLQWLLDRARSETSGEESRAAVTEAVKEGSGNGEHVVGMNLEEEIVANNASWSSGTIVEQAEEIRGEPFTITEIISRIENELKDLQHFNRMQSAELEQVPTQAEEPTPTVGRADAIEEKEQVPHFLRPDDQLNDPEMIQTSGNGDPYAHDELPAPVAEWQEKLAAEPGFGESTAIDEAPVAEPLDAPLSNLEAQESSSMESGAEVILPPSEEDRIVEAEQIIHQEDTDAGSRISDQALEHADRMNQGPSDTFDDFEEEEQEPESKRVYFFWEKEFYANQTAQDEGAEHMEEENTMAAPESKEVRAQVLEEEPNQDFKEEQKDEVPLFFDAALSARDKEKPEIEDLVDEESKANQTIEEIPSPLSSILEKEIQEADKPESELAFQPYHTIDYFASQGIRFIQEENPTDKFGKQLKSFTAWLKTMKRLPQSLMETEMSATAEAAIQSIAQHSLDEKEVVTEAMAEVLFLQERFDRALEMYNQLSLLDPSKSTYFAAKIAEIKSHLI